MKGGNHSICYYRLQLPAQLATSAEALYYKSESSSGATEAEAFSTRLSELRKVLTMIGGQLFGVILSYPVLVVNGIM